MTCACSGSVARDPCPVAACGRTPLLARLIPHEQHATARRATNRKALTFICGNKLDCRARDQCAKDSEWIVIHFLQFTSSGSMQGRKVRGGGAGLIQDRDGFGRERSILGGCIEQVVHDAAQLSHLGQATQYCVGDRQTMALFVQPPLQLRFIGQEVDRTGTGGDDGVNEVDRDREVPQPGQGPVDRDRQLMLTWA